MHDRLLEDVPDGVVHDSGHCEFCQDDLAAAAAGRRTEGKGVPVGDKTYSQAEFDAAVAKAVDERTAELAAKVGELEAKTQEAGTAAAVAAAVAERDSKIAEIGQQLDVATAEAATAKQAMEAQTAFLAAAVEEQTAEQAKAERRAARVIEMKAAVPGLTDEYLEEKGDTWAAFEDAQWAAHLETLRTVASAAPASTVIPSTTVLAAAREPGDGNKLNDAESLMRKVLIPTPAGAPAGA